MLFLRLTGMSSMSIMRTRITYHICMRILIHWHEPVKQRIITRLKTFHMIALKPYMEYQRISAEIIMRSWFRTACNLCNRYAIVRFQMYSMRTSSSDHNGATHADKAYDDAYCHSCHCRIGSGLMMDPLHAWLMAMKWYEWMSSLGTMPSCWK